MRRLALLLALLPALSAPVAEAQDTFEIAPFVGIRSAGSFRGEDQLVNFSVDNSVAFGLFADYRITKNFGVEFLWSHQGSTLTEQRTVLEDPDNPIETPLFDVGVDYIHGGAYFAGGNELITPYVAGGLGAAIFSPDGGDTSNLSRFSFNVGAGLRGSFNPRFGYRFDARAFGTRAGESREDLTCGVFGCISFEAASTFWQAQFVGAFTIRF